MFRCAHTRTRCQTIKCLKLKIDRSVICDHSFYEQIFRVRYMTLSVPFTAYILYIYLYSSSRLSCKYRFKRDQIDNSYFIFCFTSLIYTFHDLLLSRTALVPSHLYSFSSFEVPYTCFFFFFCFLLSCFVFCFCSCSPNLFFSAMYSTIPCSAFLVLFSLLIFAICNLIKTFAPFPRWIMNPTYRDVCQMDYIF
eukprot:TRINITY_DN2600_c0_g1::TRINITY_DN2600_c0_g1_i1::g.19452::m.19452 TRINITY_DN2600_c0_g1::TRINITY_DN2600_c0_g1_i1::g.19452  ORF type:complete len:194 (+),score=-38.30,Pex24p/PF06398.6/12 TRINITY_DN2600_c0_g1_i1:668-1249(+)